MRLLKSALHGVLSSQEISKIISAFDIVGDIAVIKVPDELVSKKVVVGEAIISRLKNVGTVLAQASPLSGELRIRDLEYICGENKSVTLHREHGCSFKVDLARTFFSPRLATERLRVARQVKEGEVVVNLFGGVGPFSILIAKLQPRSKVYSVDMNKTAYELAKENIVLNKVSERVIPILGDARKITSERLRGKASRVLMPYPKGAKKFLESALLALGSEGGMIHYYTHCRADDKAGALAVLKEELSALSTAAIKYSKVVREVGAGWLEVVADLRINPFPGSPASQLID